MPNIDMISFLDKYVKPATGCTEPIAVAYATALAYRTLVEKCPVRTGLYCATMADNLTISIKTDRDVFKNALNVAIPNTEDEDGSPITGMAIAAAMALYANPDDELNLLAKVGKEAADNAKKLLESGKVTIEEVIDTGAKADLDIEVTVKCGSIEEKRTACARLQHNHDNITKLELDGQPVTIYDEARLTESAVAEQAYFPQSVEEIISAVDEIDLNKDRGLFGRLYEGLEMDIKLAEEGLRQDKKYGLEFGKHLQSIYGLPGETLNDILQIARKVDMLNVIEILAGAAGDARMGGANFPAMSSAGSGNQGLVAILPVLVAGKMHQKTDEETCEAALLSHLITKYVADRSGYLSAMCGCNTKAGIGAVTGVTYLLMTESMDKKTTICNAINYFVADTTGTVCDGAKTGCTEKLSTGARQAARSALIALESRTGPGINGIVHSDVNETIEAIGELSESMVPVDLRIVSIMEGNK